MHLKISTVLFMLLYFISMDGIAAKADYQQTKSVNKKYKVAQSDKLTIDNKFGDVKITTWDKNELEVNITITVTASSEKEVLKRIDNIDVKIDESADEKSFKTYFVNEKKNISNGKSEISIDYEVKMPKTNNLDVKNSFGAFIINDIDGRVIAKVKFGSARVGKVSHPDSDLRFEFSDPVEIEHIERSRLTLKYSKMSVTSATELKLISEFSNSEIQAVGNLETEIKFGSIEIRKAIKVMIKSNMSNVEIEELMEEGDFKAKYGSLEIKNVKNTMTRLVIDGEFSPIDIDIEEGASFNARLRSSMAKLKVPDLDWKKEEKEMNSAYYEGSFGQSSDNKLWITTSFGTVKLDF